MYQYSLYTNGELIKSFGRLGKGPGHFNSSLGLAVDKKGTVYISDRGNNHMQIFS